MPFMIEIAATEFKEKKLKVVSSVPLDVSILDPQEQIVEQFVTDPDETIYPIQYPLTEEMRVKIQLIPGSVVDFYPVVQAM